MIFLDDYFQMVYNSLLIILCTILTQEPEEAIEYLHNVTHNNDRNVNGTVMVDLMGRVLLKLRNRTGATSQLRKTALQVTGNQ